MIGKIWKTISALSTAYWIYERLNKLNKSKDEFYESLDPEMQAQYIKVFGNPYPVIKPVEIPPVRV